MSADTIIIQYRFEDSTEGQVVTAPAVIDLVRAKARRANIERLRFERNLREVEREKRTTEKTRAFLAARTKRCTAMCNESVEKYTARLRSLAERRAHTKLVLNGSARGGNR